MTVNRRNFKRFTRVLPVLWLASATGGCPRSLAPPPRPERVDRPGRRAVPRVPLSLPADGQPRFLQRTVPLPLPRGGLLVHLERPALRGWPAALRLERALWSTLRVDSVGAGQLWPYLRRCGVDPRRQPRALTLVQPLEGRPEASRMVVLWGLMMTQRIVACLRTGMEADGARTRTIPAGGEPAFQADRPASDLRLAVVALDDETLLVAAGARYRRALGRLVRDGGASITRTPLYQRAVREAPSGTALLAVLPRLPRHLPHVPLPPSVVRSTRSGLFHAGPMGAGLWVTASLTVAGPGRARRWARRLPDRAAHLAPLLSAAHRPFLKTLQPSARPGQLRIRLTVPPRRLEAFGGFVARWLPW